MCVGGDGDGRVGRCLRLGIELDAQIDCFGGERWERAGHLPGNLPASRGGQLEALLSDTPRSPRGGDGYHWVDIVGPQAWEHEGGAHHHGQDERDATGQDLAAPPAAAQELIEGLVLAWPPGGVLDPFEEVAEVLVEAHGPSSVRLAGSRVGDSNWSRSWARARWYAT